MRVLICGAAALALLSCSPSDTGSTSETSNEDAGLVEQTGHLERLADGFRTPPAAAKPRTWWHWIDGNVTAEGITADLEWMERVGIGGFQLFDVAAGAPHIVDDPVVFGSEEWASMVAHSVDEARRLDLEVTLHAAAGWSQTGGPWVEPEQAMKKFVWTETNVVGGSQITIDLPQPTAVSGPYQDYPADPPIVLPNTLSSIEGGRPHLPSVQPPPSLYRDQRVFAYRIDQQSAVLDGISPNITIDGQAASAPILLDHLYAEDILLPRREDTPVTVSYDYGQPVTVDSVVVGAATHKLPEGRIEARDDNGEWRAIKSIPGPDHEWVNTFSRSYSFEPVTGSEFRVVLTGAPPPATFASLLGLPIPTEYSLSELRFARGRVERAEDKSGFALLYDYHEAPTSAQATATSEVIDVTEMMDEDGMLTWDAPEGHWRVVRLGYSLTGKQNHPAPNEGRGLEVDKLNTDHVEAYLEGFAAPLPEGVFADDGVNYLLLDSWEAGTSTWTQGILEAFERRRGYDPGPYLPALTGAVVADALTTEKFLWDWRLTLSDLLTDNHNGTVQRFANDRGAGIYAESMGTRMATLGDGMALKADAEVPMAEFWYVPTGDPFDQLEARYRTDIREAFSVANIYGQKLVAAEAFTTLPIFPPWGQGPRDLKFVADYYMGEGVNRFVIHSSDHQPLDDVMPGLTLWQFGQYLNRHETWAEDASAFFDYLARSSFMLQQGVHVADVAFLLGEGAPLSVPFWNDDQPALPDGYDYDYLDARTVLERTTVEDGQIVTGGGTRYSVLILPDSMSRVTVKMSERLLELASEGLSIVGPEIVGSPSWADGEDGDRSVRSTFEALRETGNYLIGLTPGEAVERLGLTPALGLEDWDDIAWMHRRTESADIHFVANLSTAERDLTASPRLFASEVTFWDPETGKITQLTNDGEVKMTLAPQQAGFLVFSNDKVSAAQSALTVSDVLLELNDGWQVSFPETEQTGLGRWDQLVGSPLRDFSGTAVYRTTFDLEARPAGPVILDLGEAHTTVSVSLNGVEVGKDVFPPYELDVSAAIRLGSNELEVAVTNLWANRLMADATGSAEDSETQSGYRPYTEGTIFHRVVGGQPIDRFPSGLVGPVRLLSAAGE
ncbi:MAG: glycosyl hydrolase [Pseudomonadota bacterium]